LQGANLGGPWSIVPNVVNIKPYAVPNPTANSGYLLVRLKNLAGASGTFYWQLQLVVLR
jgi:hypothetical protein